MNPNPPLNQPLTEADLHAYVDCQLTPERHTDIEAYLAHRPEEAQRAEIYRAQKRELHALFDPVLDEALPSRLLQAAQPRTPWYMQSLAAGLAIALLGGGAGWVLRASLGDAASPMAQGAGGSTPASAAGFAQRAAIAHAVYSPDTRRAVEINAAHEDQLVAWLSKRMGAPMRPPALLALGYALDGGRLLPGGQGPVAQFMYSDASGAKLTLYVSNEVAALEGDGGKSSDTAFRFARQGELNVFYWVDGAFGYAIAGAADRAVLAAVSAEVHSQLAGRAPK